MGGAMIMVSPQGPTPKETNNMTTRPITDDQAQALAAYTSWHLGSERWATAIERVLADPQGTRDALIKDGLPADQIDRAFRRAFPDRYDRLTQKGTTR